MNDTTTTTTTEAVVEDDHEVRRHPVLRALGWVAIVALAIWPFPVW